jgi:hypothetical protein
VRKYAKIPRISDDTIHAIETIILLHRRRECKQMNLLGPIGLNGEINRKHNTLEKIFRYHNAFNGAVLTIVPTLLRLRGIAHRIARGIRRVASAISALHREVISKTTLVRETRRATNSISTELKARIAQNADTTTARARDSFRDTVSRGCTAFFSGHASWERLTVRNVRLTEARPALYQALTKK